MIVDRAIENLVGPHVDELGEAGVSTTYYDQPFLESLADTSPLPEERRRNVSAQSVRSLVYTSGTTGLPKGVMIMAGRHLNTARGMATYLRLKPTDKFYTCLPLYHGAAQGLCTTPVIFAGASMTLGRKFSHKTFWPEVSASKANILQYVGELCRYLVNAPVHPLERKHKIQYAWGNGMRPDVWEVFRQRFNIPVIHELYAATDGMGATFNYNAGEFSRNSIGVRGLLWHRASAGREIRARIDPDTEEIQRDETGFVKRAGVDEPGEVLHRVDPAMKQAAFLGYFKNEGASEKRWMRNVFEKDDLWFRSGDVMREDADGRVFFVDRLGDTFRWKSENVRAISLQQSFSTDRTCFQVSTNEVSDVIGTFPQIAECNVYGVAVPNADGRCGCATIVCQPPTTPETLDLHALAGHVRSKLPRYAVPVFLRVAPQLAYTGTFKIQKGQAKREGVDIDLIEQSGSKDRLLWLPPDSGSYVLWRREDWEALKAGKVKI